MTTLPFDRPHPLRPPPAYAEMRATEPVAAVTTSDGRPAWLVTSYDAVTAVLGDPRFGVVPPGSPPGQGATLLQDGHPHRRLRRLVGGAFTPARIGALRPRITRLAEAQADALLAGGSPGDLVSGFAAPLSIAVIAELLGVALEDRERFRQLADAAGAADFTTMDTAAEQAWGAFAEFVGGLIAAKSAHLGEDLLSALIEETGLSDYERTTLVLTILASGYLTAANAISVGATLLLTEGRLAALAGSTEETLRATVEEVVRLQIGLIGEVFPRWALADLDLEGVRLHTGDLVLARLGAANRDPAHFAEPDEFRPRPSTEERHVAFGRGPHHCLGAALARLELGIALRALATKLPTLRLSVSVHDIDWVTAHADSGPVAVGVSW
ncbi:cytochrome P450 [Amycolatopsis magusensis]|uniref:cytochrome P450 n=1 Tax=Amycolatopsis magusensis TaxID=882444 RepID=UPI003799A079